MKHIFKNIDKLKIKGTPKEEKEFAIFKEEVKRNVLEMEYVVRKKLHQLTKHHANTMKHNVMVAHDVKYIAERLRLPHDEIQALFIAALLHDIGKLDVLDILLDASIGEEREMLEIKRKENPHDFKLKDEKIIPVDAVTVEDLIKYKNRKDGLDEAKVRRFLKEKRIPLTWTLRQYLNVHQERTEDILRELGMDPKIIEYAASHHPEYFADDIKLNWKCNIISIADKFNAIIQSEGVRNYMTRQNRILALDTIIECLRKRFSKLVFSKRRKAIIRALAQKYIPYEVNHFLLPYSKSMVKALRHDKRIDSQKLKEIEEVLINIEKTFEVNDKVKYILDMDIIHMLRDIESELESVVKHK